jgi:hypothetical protein
LAPESARVITFRSHIRTRNEFHHHDSSDPEAVVFGRRAPCRQVMALSATMSTGEVVRMHGRFDLRNRKSKRRHPTSSARQSIPAES